MGKQRQTLLATLRPASRAAVLAGATALLLAARVVASPMPQVRQQPALQCPAGDPICSYAERRLTLHGYRYQMMMLSGGADWDNQVWVSDAREAELDGPNGWRIALRLLEVTGLARPAGTHLGAYGVGRADVEGVIEALLQARDDRLAHLMREPISDYQRHQLVAELTEKLARGQDDGPPRGQSPAPLPSDACGRAAVPRL